MDTILAYSIATLTDELYDYISRDELGPEFWWGMNTLLRLLLTFHELRSFVVACVILRDTALNAELSFLQCYSRVDPDLRVAWETALKIVAANQCSGHCYACVHCKQLNLVMP